jgi:hypothetical protein
MVELTRRIADPTADNHARIWMLAQTHTLRKDGGDDPFAKINRKGTKVWFGSGWDTSYLDPGGQYDVYQIDLPATWWEDMRTLTEFRILTSSLANGIIASNYSQNLQATGGSIPYKWSVTSRSLPGGLSLNTTTGVISGTPTNQGSFNFTIQASDSSSPAKTSSRGWSITINAAVDTTKPAPPNGVRILHGP